MRGGGLMNLLVLIVIGVILADMIKNWQGTNAILGTTAAIWQTGVNGMLGQPTVPQQGAPAGKTQL